MASRVLLAPLLLYFLFFFNDTATPEIYTLSLHDALPISCWYRENLYRCCIGRKSFKGKRSKTNYPNPSCSRSRGELRRSEEHTSELQSRPHLVCRLLLEKKKKI